MKQSEHIPETGPVEQSAKVKIFLPAARTQAQQLAQYLSKGGDSERWFSSKDFSGRQRHEILAGIAQLNRTSESAGS